MLPYIYFFLLSLFLGYVWERADHRLRLILEFSLYFLLFVFIGLKLDVGTDSGNYLRIYNEIALSPVFKIKLPEISYYLVNHFSIWLNAGMMLVYLICGFVFSLFTWLAAREFKVNPCYFLALVMPFHLVMLGISGIRQGVAESIVIYALALLWNEKSVKFIIFILFATTFHSSALFFISFALINYRKRWLILGMLAMLPLLLFFADDKYGHYMQLSMFSQGVVLRIGFLIVPVMFFLYFRHEIDKHGLTVSRLFYISIIIVPVLVALSLISTTLVDRVAYYFILLSSALVLVLARYTKSKVESEYLLVGTVATSFVSLLVFSFFGNNAQFYTYNSYLIHWLSNSAL